MAVTPAATAIALSNLREGVRPRPAPVVAVSIPGVLFARNEYNRAAGVRFRVAMEALLPIVQPALKMFEVREVEAVPTGRVTIDEERSVEFVPVHAEQTIRFDPRRVVAGDLAAVREALIAAATTSANARVAVMRANLDAMTEATGQVVRVSREMNWDDLMVVIADMPIAFDERGEPTFVLWPPRAQAEYEALGPRNSDQEQRWQVLLREKREEARARERDRRLR